MQPLLGDRRKNLSRVLMPVGFACQRDLYLSDGEFVETESEDVQAARNRAEPTERRQRWFDGRN
jgi:hypothetical protein